MLLQNRGGGRSAAKTGLKERSGRESPRSARGFVAHHRDPETVNMAALREAGEVEVDDMEGELSCASLASTGKKKRKSERDK